MSEQCKQCETDLEGKEFKKVAEWSFCTSCFDELMAASAKKKEAPVSAPVPASSKAEPELAGEQTGAPAGLAMRFSVGPSTLRCQTCKKELLEHESHALLGTRFCATCYEVLAEGFTTSDKADSSNQEPEPAPEPVVPQVTVDLTAQANCFACDKWIRKIAAKLRDDHMYCPDCFAQLPPEEKSKPTSAGSCKACGEQATELESVEGFSICGPCLSTDRELAIKLARDRHLAKMKQGL